MARMKPQLLSAPFHFFRVSHPDPEADILCAKVRRSDQVCRLIAAFFLAAMLIIPPKSAAVACGGGGGSGGGESGESGGDGSEGDSGVSTESEPPPGFRPSDVPWLSGSSGESSSKTGQGTQDLINTVNQIGMPASPSTSPVGITQGEPDAAPAGIAFFRTPAFSGWRSQFAIQFRQFGLLNLSRSHPWGRMSFSWSQLQMLLSRDLLALLRDYGRSVGFVVYGLHGLHPGQPTSPQHSSVLSKNNSNAGSSSGNAAGSSGSSTGSGSGASGPGTGTGQSGGPGTGTSSSANQTSVQNTSTSTTTQRSSSIGTTVKGNFSLPPAQALYSWGGNQMIGDSGAGSGGGGSATSSPAGAGNVSKGIQDTLSEALLTPAQQEAAKEASTTVNNFMEKTTERVSEMLHSLAIGDHDRAERQSNAIWGNAQERLAESGKHGAMVGKGLSETPSSALAEANKTLQSDAKSTFTSQINSIFSKHAMRATGQ